MVMAWLFPVATSLADTLRIPFASMSKVTSICGVPRGDLRSPSGRRGDPDQVEPPQGPVVPGHLAFALQHVDLHGGLAVGGRRERLRLLGGDGGVALDELGRHPTEGLDAQGEGSHVEEQHVLHVTGQDARLHGRTHGNDLVGIHSLVRVLAEEVADQLLDLRHAGHPAHKDDFVDLLRVDPRVLEALAHGSHRPLEEVFHELLQLRACQLEGQVLGSRRIRGHER
jgi:hypothetical protein